MMLDLLQMTAYSYATETDTLDAFEVAQYIHLSEEIELHMAMGSPFSEAVSLALETAYVI